MDSLILTELAVAGAAILGAALLGFFLQRGCGVLIGVMLTTMACGLCVAGTKLLGLPGLAGGLVVAGVLAWAIGNRYLSKQGAVLLAGLWLGFCAVCIIGYILGGAMGVAAIAFPTNLLFWALLYLLSGYLLPLRDDSQREQAFRSLLTFSIRTNYPYRVLRDRELEDRVPGNPFRSFFAGPGIILTGCDHVAVLTDGTSIKVPEEPGLTFTGRFETVQRLVDLRPQLRSFHVEARTLDGIPIRVLAFIPFRINSGGQKPEAGHPFPFQRRAIFRAVTSEVLEQDPAIKHKWDELIEIHATRILRDIICRYRFDDLCLALGPYVEGTDDIVRRYEVDESPFPYDPKRDPRYRIRDEMVNRLKRQMKPLGIEVIGGGISNLLPMDKTLIQQRIDNWRTKWQSRMKAVQADRDATRIDLIDQSEAGVDQALFLTMAKMLSETQASGQDMSEELIAATYIASLQRMAENRQVKDKLGPDTQQKLTYLRPHGQPLLVPSTPDKGAGD